MSGQPLTIDPANRVGLVDPCGVGQLCLRRTYT